MDRIAKLRSRIFDGLLFSNEFHYLFYKEYERLSDQPEPVRYSESFYYAFSNLTPSIADGELIVGQRDYRMPEARQTEWETVYKPIAQARVDKAGWGQDSHMTVDYDLLLNKGISGIMAKIEQYTETLSNGQDAEDKLAYYNCCRRCLEAIVKHSENYAAKALQLSKETTDPKRRSELEKIAGICAKVPANPAETFYEAVQSVHFITYCLSLDPYRLGSQQFQLGRPDRYLLPFYEKDIQNGTLTKDEAQLLLDCLGIQINMRVPNGLSSGYMVGGRDENNAIVANDLTEMCMQVIDDIKLVYPAVGLCHTEGMPERFLQKAIALLQKGYSHPAIFNDDVIAKGLVHYGIPAKDSRNYIHSTCVEITPIAASNVWVASPYTNMPQLLLDIMDREYGNLEELLHTYFETLDARIKSNFEHEMSTRRQRAANSIKPLLSCFVNDCLERGMDIEQGGAVYNWIMPSFVGMANLVDAIYAINTLVFEQKKLGIVEFKEILDRNFEGSEALQTYILNQIPKYGNDIDDVDRYFNLFTDHIVQECAKYHDPLTNTHLIPSVFCWVMHEQFGRQTSATPDGRMAGFPLGDGSGPCQGREMNGPTASVISSTKWVHSKFIGGVAVNLKFSKSSLGAHSAEVIEAIVLTYLTNGGFEVQINVVDNETLKKAQANPELYRDLVVRIGGYSDYFVKLSPKMQEEVILRTAHTV